MSIVKDSITLREMLVMRFKEIYPSDKYEFNQSQVIKDAEERGFKIASSALSRYLKGDKKNSSLSETQIVWLALRYGVPISLQVGLRVVEDNTVKFVLPRYNESEAIKKLKMVFK